MANAPVTDDVFHRLLQAETDEELYEASLDAVTQVLDADSSQLVRVEDDELEVIASANTDSFDDESVPVATDIVGQLDLIGRSHIFGDIRDVRSVSASQAGITDDQLVPRSLLVVPIDSIGLLVAIDGSTDAFNETDQQWAEQLAQLIDGMLQSSDSGDNDPEVNRLNRIATILSHDFAGPLTVARGSLELAEETGEEDYFDRAYSALDQIEQLVEGIERLASAGESYPRPEMLELRSMAEEVWPAIDHGDATIEIRDSRKVLADEHALAQLLRNLFTNAIDHGANGVTIRIGALENGFYVEDNGPGIPEEDRELIFSWGYTNDDDHKGIGLSIVEQICDVHDWDISVTDSDLGGARFEIIDTES